jgi:CubicO group peptidase (beta-lactamase class C family)
MGRFPVVVSIVVASVSYAAEPFEWKAERPEACGMSAERVEALRESLAGRGTKALLVVRRDRVVLEWYAPTHAADKPHYTASLAKSLVGGMSLAVAMQDGRIRPEDVVSGLVPAWRGDLRKSKITVAHLATHSSGVEDAEENEKPHEQLTGWKGDFWKRQPDPFTISRDQAPVMFEPGERVAYSNPGMAMLSYAVTAAIKEGQQKDVRSLLRERVLRPIGVADSEWSCGYGKTYRVDDLDLVPNWGGGGFTARAAARVGRLMLRRGEWEGERLLDEKIVRTVLEWDGAPRTKNWSGAASPRPVLGWYANIDKVWPKIPRDAFCGGGAGHQLLMVVPSLDLIVVRFGDKLAPKDFWAAAEKFVFEPAVGAVVDPPAPPSDAIREIRFDPPEKIIRKAPDSDNWPMTWGDDDAIYTSYGDGRGFEPFVEKKLSLGLARITGGPLDFAAQNLRSPTAERVGDGAKGAKASGMLMVDGVLYMWVRNVGNSQLAWSADRGKTWGWGFKFEESFGCPAFLNFGRNYEGARDEFVYLYSQDGPGAYEPYDGVALARVRKDRIREREAYEFFVDGKPTWSKRLEDRGHVLAYPKHCERLDAVYNGGIKRYLMTVGYGHGKGWGLYDAPAPWGPWTVAFTANDWGQGETHGYRLATKWMSADGRRMYLVFSGRKWGEVQNDAFCVRGMDLVLFRPE